MEAIRLKTHVGDDGILKLELPETLHNRDLDVFVVIQPLETEPLDEMGYPIGYFDETYGSLADDPIERGEQPPLEERDPVE